MTRYYERSPDVLPKTIPAGTRWKNETFSGSFLTEGKLGDGCFYYGAMPFWKNAYPVVQTADENSATADAEWIDWARVPLPDQPHECAACGEPARPTPLHQDWNRKEGLGIEVVYLCQEHLTAANAAELIRARRAQQGPCKDGHAFDLADRCVRCSMARKGAVVVKAIPIEFIDCTIRIDPPKEIPYATNKATPKLDPYTASRFSELQDPHWCTQQAKKMQARIEQVRLGLEREATPKRYGPMRNRDRYGALLSARGWETDDEP